MNTKNIFCSLYKNWTRQKGVSSNSESYLKRSIWKKKSAYKNGGRCSYGCNYIPSYLREHTSIVHTYNHTYIISFYISWGWLGYISRVFILEFFLVVIWMLDSFWSIRMQTNSLQRSQEDDFSFLSYNN